MLVNEEFKNFNLAENFQKRIKCAARLLDRLEYLLMYCRLPNKRTTPNNRTIWNIGQKLINKRTTP